MRPDVRTKSGLKRSKKRGPKRGDQLGQWRLGKRLGGGGNGWVFKALDEQGEVAGALKVNFSTKADSADRFQREVRVQRELQDLGLALPILDASEEDSDPAWFVMPIGTQLKPDPYWGVHLQATVRTVLQLADIMARVHELGHSHRDVKPENIISWQDDWYLSDFGLVTDPNEDAELTDHLKPLGAKYYQADELIRRFHRPDEDFRPADVYGLVKVLWVLGTGQNFPPPGWQPSDVPIAALSSYSNHPRAELLDAMIDAGTSLDPSDRPTAAAVAQELRLWLDPPGPAAAVSMNLDEIAAPLRRRAAAEKRRERRMNNLAAKAMEMERIHLAPALVRIRTLLRGQVTFKKQDTGSPLSAMFIGSTDLENFHGGCETSYLFYQERRSKVLVYGYEIGWDGSGKALVSAGMLLVDDEMFANPDVAWEMHEVLTLGTPSAYAKAQQMAAEMEQQAGLGVQRLAKSLG